MFGGKAWRGRSYNLGKMTFRELVVAYLTYPAIQVYMLLALASVVAAAILISKPLLTLAAVAVTVVVYPLVWYVLHRWVLHSRFLYKLPMTAALWKRIHFDHHQDPYKLEVLFGSLANTLPTIALVTAPVGYLLAGPGGAAAALATGLFCTCFYEFCHCVQHLNYKPKYEFLRRMKQAHLLHHFHNEQANFGITNFTWDRLFGTRFATAKDIARSETVFNLGYDEAEAERYPWVARMTEGALKQRSRYRESGANNENDLPLASGLAVGAGKR